MNEHVHSMISRLAMLAALAFSMAACAPTLQSVARDCKSQHTEFNGFANCVQREPSETSASYKSIYFAGLKQILNDVNSGKQSDLDAFLDEAALEANIDQQFSNSTAQRQNAGLALMLMGANALNQRATQPVVSPPVQMHCYTSRQGNGISTNCQ